ncbi:ig-like domain-containing protein [Caerostris extrusa]|uniref:Ig-like domain-containing protein n=1 Tax=Caerostris extrusa TaxID=172846 RepID=A0AAV4QH29_CAEEX|nr:ig-like domain-containing protein [Caerostris extrusa]
MLQLSEVNNAVTCHIKKIGISLTNSIPQKGSCYALRFLNISVPGAVSVGKPVWLKCDFDLEGDDLYSVKWYKNHVEFYRYQPRDRPPGQTYRLAGTFVDLTSNINPKLSQDPFLRKGVRCQISFYMELVKYVAEKPLRNTLVSSQRRISRTSSDMGVAFIPVGISEEHEKTCSLEKEKTSLFDV